MKVFRESGYIVARSTTRVRMCGVTRVKTYVVHKTEIGDNYNCTCELRRLRFQPV